MGLRILEGVDGGDSEGRAVLYCSTSGRALPWLFDSAADAEEFVKLHGDVRRLSDAEAERLHRGFYAALSLVRDLSLEPRGAT